MLEIDSAMERDNALLHNTGDMTTAAQCLTSLCAVKSFLSCDHHQANSGIAAVFA